MDTNSITGDRLVSKSTSKEYRENYDKIFKPSENIPSTPPLDSILNIEENDIGC